MKNNNIIKHYTTFLFSLFLLSFTSFTVIGYTLNSDNFNTGQTFTTNGWSYSNGGCGAASEYNKPVALYDNFMFGTNQSNGCAFQYTRSIRIDTSAIVGSGTASLSSDFYVLNDSTDLSSIGIIDLMNSTYTSGKKITFSMHKTYANVTGSNLGTTEPCGILYSNYGISVPFNMSINFIIDVTNKLYNLYLVINGSSLHVCENKVYTTLSSVNVGGVGFLMQPDASETLIAGFDNFVLDTTASNITGTGSIPVNMPCTTDSDCITDNCVFGVCQYKTSLQGCTYNYECLSQSCINNVCGKASAFQAIDDFRKNTFGSDKETSNMIALIFIAISVAGILIIAGIAHAIKAGFYLAILAVFLEVFFFAIIGWLSFFIVFALVLVSVIFIIATIFIMNRMPN